MGDGHHLLAHLGRMAVSGGRTRFVLPSGDWLVDEADAGAGACAGCLADGDLAQAPQGASGDPLRPGSVVRQRRRATLLRRSWPEGQHEPAR